MTDVVVTVPADQWDDWIAEGDLPGEPWSGNESHFWVRVLPAQLLTADSRLYVVARGKLRGYAPIVEYESICRLDGRRSCILRRGGAVAVTIPEGIPGFRGFRYRWWQREVEVPLPDWRTA